MQGLQGEWGGGAQKTTEVMNQPWWPLVRSFWQHVNSLPSHATRAASLILGRCERHGEWQQPDTLGDIGSGVTPLRLKHRFEPHHLRLEKAFAAAFEPQLFEKKAKSTRGFFTL